MPRISKFAALALLGVITAAPAHAESTSAATAENKPAAIVNGVPIPQERVDLRTKIVASQAQGGGQPDSPELRKAIIDDLINIEIMSQEATKKGLDKQPETVQQLALAKETVLVSAFVQDYVKSHPISEEELAQGYETLKKGLGDKEYNVRHILVEKESEAKSIAAKLKKGGKDVKFEKLAEASSKDAGSREHGGDLGWIPVGNISGSFVKPFADALMGLTKGQISEPVQSQYGWHIIKLEDVRDLKIPSYDDLKPQLAQRMQQQVVQKLIADLRAKAKIE